MTRTRYFLMVLLAVACGDAPDAPAPPVGEPRTERGAEGEITVTLPDSGVYLDYQWATRTDAPDTLRARLEAWLERHGPVDGSYQDAVHVRFHRMAQYRLARAYYHAGMIEAGDSLMARLEETDEVIR